jgi:hypothetical protein
MKSGSVAAGFFSRIVGSGPGSGMSLQFVIAGILYISAAIGVTLFVPMVRNLEDNLPDHDKLKKMEAPSKT